MRHLQSLILAGKKSVQILFFIIYGVTQRRRAGSRAKKNQSGHLGLAKCLFYGDWAAGGRESCRPEERRTIREAVFLRMLFGIEEGNHLAGTSWEEMVSNINMRMGNLTR